MTTGTRPARLLLPPLLLALALVLGACAAPRNPSFAADVAQGEAAMRAMRDDPKPGRHPVVIVSGLFDVGWVIDGLADRVRGMLDPGTEVVVVGMFGTSNMDECRRRVVESLEAALPSDDPLWTTEVDVIGFSLGGVVARHAALPEPGAGKRLRIARLFTISSPHAGCHAADWPSLDDRVVAIRAGSSFLERLDVPEAERGYPIHAYVRLDDRVVGPENAAPRGCTPWWVPNRSLEFAHAGAYKDPRILADIGRRLRGEEPLTREPPAPLPGATARTDTESTHAAADAPPAASSADRPGS